MDNKLLICLTALLSFVLLARKCNAQSSASIQIFLVDPSGNPISTTSVPTAISWRILPTGQNVWSAPTTVSTQATQTVTSSPNDQVDIGVYNPTGYEIWRYTENVQNCSWMNGHGSPPSYAGNPTSYTLYQPAHPNVNTTSDPNFEAIRPTFFVNQPAAGTTTCVTFMLQPDSADTSYSVYGKTTSGSYYEVPWSSAMNLPNVSPDKIDTLSMVTNTLDTTVQLDVSETVGSTIVHFYVTGLQGLPSTAPCNAQPGKSAPACMQLIRSQDAGDSGMQWTALTQGVNVGELQNGNTASTESANFNQAVGADPYWMWGMTVPLTQPPSLNDSADIVYQTPSGIWVPIYSDSWNREPSMNTSPPSQNQSDPSQFLPRSPLYQPASLRIFDGRIEELSLRNVTAPNGNSVLQVTSNFHVRSHLAVPFDMSFYRLLLWSALTADGSAGGIAHNVRIYVVDVNKQELYLGDAGDTVDGSLKQNPPTTWPTSNGNVTFGAVKPGTSCSNTACDLDFGPFYGSFAGLDRIVLVFDYGTSTEQVVSMHLPEPDPTGFSSEVSFSNTGTADTYNINLTYQTNGTPWTNANPSPTPFVIPTNFSSGPSGKGNTIVYSVGKNANLNNLSTPLGY